MANVNSIVLVQGRTEETPISIGGMDVSTTDRTIQIVIKSLPRNGVIFANQQILKKGSVIQVHEGESNVLVSYKSNDDLFFTLPRSQSTNAVPYAADKFEFTIEAIHPVTGESLNGNNNTLLLTQHIEVQNLNHRPSLIVPETSVTLTAPLLESPFATIDGIYVNDIDNDVNMIRVDVWSDNGELTLNDKYRSLADFESCNSRWEFDWSCRGDGLNDRNMTFLAEPSHLGSILADLEYTSFFYNTEDTVTVQVYDGIGGQCISQEEQAFSTGPNLIRYPSVQNGCYGVSASVKILLSPEQAGGTGSGADSGSKIGDFFSAQNLLAWLLYGSLLVCFCSGGWCCFRCLFGRKRGAAVNYE